MASTRETVETVLRGIGVLILFPIAVLLRSAVKQAGVGLVLVGPILPLGILFTWGMDLLTAYGFSRSDAGTIVGILASLWVVVLMALIARYVIDWDDG